MPRGVALRDIDVFAVATGPWIVHRVARRDCDDAGTGVRRGKAAHRRLRFDALAMLGANRIACAGARAIMFRRVARRVYAALYETSARSSRPRGAPRRAAATPSPTRQLLHRRRGGHYATRSNGTRRRRNGCRADVAAAAGVIARLASARADAGERPPPDAIRPLYVRRRMPSWRATREMSGSAADGLAF